MTNRCIATRLVEQVAVEAIACFDADPRLKTLYSDGRGKWRVHPWPLLPGEAQEISGRALRVGLTPPSYETGTSGTATTEYAATLQFVMEMQSGLIFPPGGLAWYDDVHALRKWLYKGGTKPNVNGSIADPDFAPGPGQFEFLTVAMTSFKFRQLNAFPNQRFSVEYDVTWETREDSQGNRTN